MLLAIPYSFQRALNGAVVVARNVTYIVPCHDEFVLRCDSVRDALKGHSRIVERIDVAVRIAHCRERVCDAYSIISFEHILETENVSVALHDLVSIAMKYGGELRDSGRQMPNR